MSVLLLPPNARTTMNGESADERSGWRRRKTPEDSCLDDAAAFVAELRLAGYRVWQVQVWPRSAGVRWIWRSGWD